MEETVTTSMNKVVKIGFFDSGLGGLSVWLECEKLLPHVDTVYLADNRNAPYGTKSTEKIIELSIKNTELLLEMGCKLVVIACNTATTAAIATLRERFDIPFVGIEPAIKPAAMHTKNKRVGVLATEGTLVSSLFQTTSKKFASEIRVINQHGTGLVKLIENGDLESEEMSLLLDELVCPLVDEDIDYLVLGCTHYPFLIPQLRGILPESVEIIDSGAAVARRVESLLKGEGFLGLNPKEKEEENGRITEIKSKSGKKLFFTNRSKELMDNFMEQINIDFRSQYMDF